MSNEKSVQFPVTWTKAPESLVERLAARWHHEICCDSDETDEDDKMVARFFIGAIADELESRQMPYDAKRSADWLRAQANTDD